MKKLISLLLAVLLTFSMITIVAGEENIQTENDPANETYEGIIPAGYLKQNYNPDNYKNILTDPHHQMPFILLMTFDLMFSLPELFDVSMLGDKNIYDSVYTFGYMDSIPCMMFISNATNEFIFAQYYHEDDSIVVLIIPSAEDKSLTAYAAELATLEDMNNFMAVNMQALMDYYRLFIEANRGHKEESPAEP